MRTTPPEPIKPAPAASPPRGEGTGSSDIAPGVSLAEVRARRGLLVRLAFRFLWNLEDAEDAVQNALLLASRRQGQLADGHKLWAWVRSIVVRQCFDVRRGNARQARIADGLRENILGTERERLGTLERMEFKDLVRDAMMTLPERQRTAMVLRHLEELDYSEVADVMGIAASTARVLVRNAREGLRQELLRRDPDWMEDAIA